MIKCHACCILSHELAGMRKSSEKQQKEQCGVLGSDNGKLNRRSTRFGQWKAGSLSDGFRQWKAESQEYQIWTMESRIYKLDVKRSESCLEGGTCLFLCSPHL